MRAAGRMLGLVLGACAAGSGHASVRVVSTNPCADAVLMAVADPAQIIAISHYSQDPRATSIPLAQARRFRTTGGSTEELVALTPDLIIGDTLMAPATVRAIRRMGVRLIQLPVPESLAESRAQVERIARSIGQAGRGRILNGRIDRAVAAAHPCPGDRPVSALIWQGGGLVLGTGTLADDLLRRTGFINHSTAYGFGKWGVVSLETLIARPPRVVLAGGAAEGGSDRLLRHPALRALGRSVALRPLPARFLRCGGPSIMAAARSLADARGSLGGKR